MILYNLSVYLITLFSIYGYMYINNRMLFKKTAFKYKTGKVLQLANVTKTDATQF